MAAEHNNDPIALLQQLEHASLLEREPLQFHAQEKAADDWAGVGYRLGGDYLLSAVDQIREVLPKMPVTPVPGTADWMMGLVNLRGTFVTVVDMARFIGGPPRDGQRGGRLLLIADNRLNCAIAVDEVFGLKQFSSKQALAEDKADTGPVSAYLTGECFNEDAHVWRVLDLLRLSKDRRFVNASA